MQFDSISAFLNMGGYGFYVWLSYGVSTFVLALLVFSSLSSHKKIKQQITQRQKREIKLRQAAERQKAQTSADTSL
ncbi:heme exporter protein CcmD [Colwellia sp. M166]|jgi:heme exporter protein D|uniref:heme exporter protein CcmD n=1 Tax=Colwellia sp. M166 TaxID=2583805 RepID=UPI00211E6A0E|nr:heme exporter protein CcmD [Colwellia sp. M166]UUO23278.1 heme exporter protein CcmD [Colwellia sp. M166]|tara:strand:+ start:4123 stop:4350 length:228 start_codon:yes stop_codon:yes gene_type:complete